MMFSAQNVAANPDQDPVGQQLVGLELADRGIPPQEDLAAILLSGRQLQGSKALLEAMEDTLCVLTELLQEAGAALAAMAAATGGAAGRAAQLRRFEGLRRQGLGLLTALWHQDRGLGYAAGPEAAGGGGSLVMLRGVPALLMGLDPVLPAVAEAALRPDGCFAEALRKVAEARDGVDADCRATIARISRNQEQLALWEDEAGLGAFGDADLSREAVLLRALEVRQQLAGRAIGLLHQTPRCLKDILAGDAG